MAGKLMGGEFIATISGFRCGVMRGRVLDKTVSQPVANTVTSISRTDTSGIEVSPEGNYAIVGSSVAPYIRILDFAAEAWVTPMATPPGSRPDDIRMSPNGTEFVAGLTSAPYMTRYSYPDFIQQTGPLVQPAGSVLAVCYGGAGGAAGASKLALGLSVSPYIEVYDLATLTKDSFTPAASAPTIAVTDIAMNPAGTLIATAGTSTASQGVRVWNYPAGTVALVDTSTDNYAIDFSPDGSKLASLHIPGSRHIRVYNTTTWAFVDFSSTGLPFLISSPRSLRWLDNTFIFASSEYSAYIINGDTGELVDFIEWGPTSSVGRCYPSPLTVPRKLAGNVTDAASNPVERVVRAYNTETGKFVGETSSDPVTGDFEMLIFSSALTTVFAIGEGGENAQIFDPVTPAAWP